MSMKRREWNADVGFTTRRLLWIKKRMETSDLSSPRERGSVNAPVAFVKLFVKLLSFFQIFHSRDIEHRCITGFRATNEIRLRNHWKIEIATFIYFWYFKYCVNITLLLAQFFSFSGSQLIPVNETSTEPRWLGMHGPPVNLAFSFLHYCSDWDANPANDNFLITKTMLPHLHYPRLSMSMDLSAKKLTYAVELEDNESYSIG